MLLLAERNKIDLEAPINRYLPDRYQSAKWDGISVHHLLSHSSGIPDYDNVVDGFCLGDTVAGTVREAPGRELEFMPGSQYKYSNIGFTLL
ncbi:MAG: CubicO group peptidase (beta-lactamase class C family) [Halieaceae bacterium]